MSTISTWKVLIVAFAGLAAAQQITKDSLAVDTVCDGTVCNQNSSCRVVQACAGSVCSPKVTCLDCVPKGADDVCNKNGLSFSVLTGSSKQPSTLIGRGCDPNQPDGEPNCPAGSRCVPDDNRGHGTCCYGKQDPAQQADLTKFNNTSFCRSECGECQPEYVCRKIVTVCRRRPCLPRYSCVQREKKGTCPRYTSLGSSWCSRTRVRCNNDFECFGSQKCCSDTCGGLRCKRPRN